ncbi:MAG: hypothetical protein M1823_005141 [Watsoniomyces obsoletus]|nr:MAG: hypothetical protein M1823_005141 [Watsoniomyces obsoletus]
MLKLQADASFLSEMPEADREVLLPQHQYRHGEFMAALTAYKRRQRVGIKDPTIPVRLQQQAVHAARVTADAALRAAHKNPYVSDPIAGSANDEELGIDEGPPVPPPADD